MKSCFESRSWCCEQTLLLCRRSGINLLTLCVQQAAMALPDEELSQERFAESTRRNGSLSGTLRYGAAFALVIAIACCIAGVITSRGGRRVELEGLSPEEQNYALWSENRVRDELWKTMKGVAMMDENLESGNAKHTKAADDQHK